SKVQNSSPPGHTGHNRLLFSYVSSSGRLRSHGSKDCKATTERTRQWLKRNPKPVNIDQPSLSQSNLEQKLENTEPRTFENNFSKAAPESPRLKAKLHKEEQRQQEAQRETEQSYDGEFESEHESDDVVVEAVTGGRAVDSCSIQIFQVHLDEQCKQLHNPDLDATRCYVSFDLPGYDMEETETPLSLPTPRPGKSRSKDFDLMFNFQKRFDFSYENEYNRRLQLATILLQGQVELRFSVVCESKDEESEFFLDLAQATVPLAELTEFPESKRSEVQAKLSIG
uniref:RPGR1_C domain-containing protein n=1 Tax=Macrostomum lignano TaxID=282301 RepID=A0A1I8H3X0_9PLAT